MIQTTYSHARAHLAELCNQVTDGREVVIIQRRGKDNIALISADELEGLLETAHLLRSPKNAERLLNALARAQARTVPPQTIAEIKDEIDLDERT
ncbi:MAG: type II toxin-antitoxin system prevent-host-death family antitoxin [Caldilineaceae bacterium]